MKKFVFSKSFVLKLLTFFIGISASLEITANEFPVANQEEALFLRRIAEFYKDREFFLVKSQISQFLEQYPESNLNDHLLAILGNVYLEENDYSNAVSSYDEIQTEDIKNKITLNLFQSLYNLKWHVRLIEECEKYIDDCDEELKIKITYILARSLYSEALDNEFEVKKAHLEKAKVKFEELIGSKYEIDASEYLSQIFCFLEDYESAANYYLDLASKNTEKKEEFLLQAALVLKNFNQEKSLSTLDLILEEKNKKQHEAAYNKILVLFDMKRFDDIITQKDDLLNLIDEEKLSLSHFYIGRSYFHKKDYEEAATELIQVKEFTDKTSIHNKLCLLMLIQSSYHLNDSELFNNSFENYSTYFPDDDQMLDTIFVKALFNKKNSNYEEAKLAFDDIKDKFLENEKFLFEYAHLIYLMQDFENSHQLFKSFGEKFVDTQFLPMSINYVINSSIQLIHQTPEGDLDQRRMNLLEDLNYVFQLERISDIEKSKYFLLLIKTNFDLQNYDAVITKIMENDISQFSTKDQAQFHLLLAYSYKNLSQDLNLFIENAKQAIALDSTISNKPQIYISLFNSYLNLSKKEDTVDEKSLLLAAEHLFQAYELNSEINKTNLFWLADLFHNQTKNYIEKHYKNQLEDDEIINTYCQRAIVIYKNIINSNPSDSLQTELPYVRLAYLFNTQKDIEKELGILEKLLQEYRFNPEVNFAFREEVIHLLAKGYEKQGNASNALALYDEFFLSFRDGNLYQVASNLHYARLKLSNIKDFTILNKDLEKIITQFKTLSLQKSFENEPLHLEAALDYVDVLCYMENNKGYDKRLFLLSNTVESFTTADDITTQDYQYMKKLLPEKEILFQSYIKVIEAEISICKGYIENDISHFTTAKNTLESLIEQRQVYTTYLDNRLQKNLKLIEEYNE